MATEAISYDKAELRAIVKSFKAMDEEATQQAKEVSSELAEYVKQRVIEASGKSYNRASRIIAEGASVRKSSKIGEISYGFARQRLSGGGTTQQVWGGYEFGSKKYKQFPTWSGKRGWFIYPTLKAIQPDIVKKWELAFEKIVRKYK